MATNRDANQKRQRANRAQREALAARTTAASTPRPSRQPPVSRRTGGEVKAPATRPTEENASRTSGRTRRARPPRPGDTPVDVATLEGSFYRKVLQVPGGSQAFMAFLLAATAVVFSIALAAFVHTVPRRGTPAKARGAPGVETGLGRYGISVLVPLVLILAVATYGLISSLRPYRRRAWLGAAVVIGVLVILGQVLFVFVAGMFAYATLRASKIEGPGEPLLGSLRRRRGADPGAEVIDTDARDTDD
ncbi:MAG: hypothetical protein ACR2MB_00120 [Acidimicrobiales bacterium]